MNGDDWKKECVAHHLGLWLVEPLWFSQAVDLVLRGVWQPKQRRVLFPIAPNGVNEEGWQTSVVMPGNFLLGDVPAGTPYADVARSQPAQETVNAKPYLLDATGLAMIGIDGQMTKGESKFGGANTLAIRRQVRAATKDPDVRGIMLAIDSPGGMVAGTQELAADVEAAGRIKPTFAHVDDLGASAAYWVAAQTGRITASATSQIGSIGVLAVVEDTSGAAEKRGIKVHVISTGPYKGAGLGTVTPEHLEYFQSRVDAINAHFLEAVARGRKASLARVQEWADGRTWLADQAQRMGLIDGIARFDDAVNQARAVLANQPPLPAGDLAATPPPGDPEAAAPARRSLWEAINKAKKRHGL